MPSLWFPSWTCRVTTLFLTFCLHFGTNNAQYDGRRAVAIKVEIQREPTDKNIHWVKAIVTTELRECVVVELYLKNLTRYRMNGSFYNKFTTCVCANEAKGLYWDITLPGIKIFAVVGRILPDKDSCGGTMTVVPSEGGMAYIEKYIEK